MNASATSSSYKEIQVKVENGVATITLNREKKGNSLSWSMCEEITDAFEKMNQDINTRVVIITGAGSKHFCTGMDLGGQNQQEMLQQLKEGKLADKAAAFFDQIYSKCNKPVIAKVNGNAFGGGFGLLFTTDFRIGVEGATFSFSEVKRGLVPANITAFVLPQIGPVKTKELMITGKKISAREAFNKGILTALAKDHNELDQMVDELVKELLENAPQAMADTKELIRYVTYHDHEANLQKVKSVFTKSMLSKEARYGTVQFTQGKKPNWTELYAKL